MMILASELVVSFPKIKARLAAMSGQRVLFIPTADCGDDAGAAARLAQVALFEDAGFSVTLFDLAHKTREETDAALSSASIVYVGGGNTFYLLGHMQKCDFSALIRRALTRGATYVGSSAGSVVCCPDIAFIAPMDRPEKSDTKETRGLGLVDFFLVPHLNHPDWGAAARQIMATHRGSIPLHALNDDEILVLTPEGVSIT